MNFLTRSMVLPAIFLIHTAASASFQQTNYYDPDLHSSCKFRGDSRENQEEPVELKKLLSDENFISRYQSKKEAYSLYYYKNTDRYTWNTKQKFGLLALTLCMTNYFFMTYFRVAHTEHDDRSHLLVLEMGSKLTNLLLPLVCLPFILDAYFQYRYKNESTYLRQRLGKDLAHDLYENWGRSKEKSVFTDTKTKEGHLVQEFIEGIIQKKSVEL